MSKVRLTHYVKRLNKLGVTVFVLTDGGLQAKHRSGWLVESDCLIGLAIKVNRMFMEIA